MNSLKIESLEYGALFSYTPRPLGTIDTMKKAKEYTMWLKQDKMVSKGNSSSQMPMTRYVAEILSESYQSLPFSNFFDEETVLIPVPSSSIVQKDGLWVPERLSREMMKMGMGYDVIPCLVREKAIRKSAWSGSSTRPSPQEHYSSMSVSKSISDFRKAILVDDVVTRGSTFLGSANRLIEYFPKVDIKCFAAIRTVSNPSDFVNWFKPVKGQIDSSLNGATRRP